MNKLLEIYDILLEQFGPQGWWPGDTPLEIMVGAVLTQNTNWSNVSKAIDNLKNDNLLIFEKLNALPVEALAQKIKPAGYFNIKAARLKNLLNFIVKEHNGSLEEMFASDVHTLREEVLTVKGVGPETADSILLYAGNKPVFVVDAYTHRIFTRHEMVAAEDGYYEIQEYFLLSLPEDIKLFNEYHALIVRLGKEFCKKSKPLCRQCPLGKLDGFTHPPDALSYQDGFFLLESTATHNECLQAEALEQAKLPVFRQDLFGGMAGKTSTICNGTADICIASCSPGIIVKAELVVIGGCCGLYDRTGK